MILENQSFKVSLMVNFNFTEKSSAKDVDFSRANTAEAASFKKDKKLSYLKKEYVLA